MTIACSYVHRHAAPCDVEVETAVDDDLAKTVFTAVPLKAGETLRIEKFVSYHTSDKVPVAELVDRCSRTLARAVKDGVAEVEATQRRWLDDALPRCVGS